MFGIKDFNLELITYKEVKEKQSSTRGGKKLLNVRKNKKREQIKMGRGSKLCGIGRFETNKDNAKK